MEFLQFSTEKIVISTGKSEAKALYSNDQVRLDVKIANKALRTVNYAIRLYNNVLDRFVPWKAFQETVAELDEYKSEYSHRSRELVGEIKALMWKGINAYYLASKYIFKWTDAAIPLLTTYVALFNNHTVQKAYTQKDLLVEVLNSGEREMKAAQQAISDSSINFNRATGELTTLNSRFQNEFNEKSEYFQSKINDIRIGVYVGLSILGPLGIGIGAAVIESKYIPELKVLMAETEDFYDHLKAKVDQAFHDIENTKHKLNIEIAEIGELKIKTKETKTFIDLDDIPELRDTLRESAQNLIDSCNEYRRKHA